MDTPAQSRSVIVVCDVCYRPAGVLDANGLEQAIITRTAPGAYLIVVAEGVDLRQLDRPTDEPYVVYSSYRYGSYQLVCKRRQHHRDVPITAAKAARAYQAARDAGKVRITMRDLQVA